MAASVGSGGTLAAVDIPVSACGLALATAGAAVAAKSATSFMADASHLIKGEINPCDKKNKLKTGTQKKSRSSGAMYGRPNAIVTNPDFIKTGKLDKYTVYGKDGTAVKEVRLTGKDHGNIPRPNIKDVEKNKNPNTGKVYLRWGEPRVPRPNEIENDLERIKKELQWEKGLYIEGMEVK